MPTKRQEATSGRCNAMTKAGSSCAAPAIRGGEFFALHSDPGRAAQLGRKGGMGNRDGAEVAVPKNRADGFHQRPIRMLLTTLAEHAFRTKDLCVQPPNRPSSRGTLGLADQSTSGFGRASGPGHFAGYSPACCLPTCSPFPAQLRAAGVDCRLQHPASQKRAGWGPAVAASLLPISGELNLKCVAQLPVSNCPIFADVGQLLLSQDPAVRPAWRRSTRAQKCCPTKFLFFSPYISR